MPKKRNIHQFFLLAPIKMMPSSHTINQNQYQETKSMIKRKLELLDHYLENALKNDASNEEVKILIGSEDFFMSSVAENARFDIAATYEMLATEFVKLSQKYPHVIICPGSFYISSPIPTSHNDFKFAQDDIKSQSLQKTTCYTANLMPVLYGGEVKRIIRKGEKIRIGKQEINSGDELNNWQKKKGKINVVSYHEDELTDLHDKATHKSATCYLGKTLLPNESIYINRYFPNKNDLFDHELEIDGMKLCILICGEFNYQDGTTAQLLNNNKYDYVLHSTIGGDITPQMQENCGAYVHSDYGGSTKLVINAKQIDEKEVTHNNSHNLVSTRYHTY